jgi:hypothetical protein
MSSTIVGEFERLVLELMEKTGIARARAEAVIRMNLPELWAAAPAARVVPKSTPADEGRAEALGGYVRSDAIDEDEEQVEVTKLFRAYGAKVRNTSQKRPSKVAPGIADLIVMFPARGFALWWEVKRQVGGEQRPDQREFEEDCRAAGWTYRLGDRFDAARYLLNLGLAEEGDGPLGILPVRAGGLPSSQ